MKRNKKIEIFEGERATRYDSFISDFFPNYNFLMDNIPQLIKGLLTDIEKANLLVVGCGTGNETKQLADYKNDWQIDACDPSKEMIDIATSKLSKYENVHLIYGTIEDIPATKKYHIITLFLVLHFLSDDGAKEDLLQNIADKLAPNGAFILFDICGSRKELEHNFEILSHSFPSDWPREEVDIRRNRILEMLNVIDENRLIQLLEKVGFNKIIKFHQSTISRAWLITKK